MTEAIFRSYDPLSGGVAAHPEEADTLREQLQQLESQVLAVRALHRPRVQWSNGRDREFCASDLREWPCPTIAALDGGTSARRRAVSDFQTTCICPDNWCPVHATCGACGTHVMIDGPDELAFCPSCLHDVLPRGVCGNARTT